MWLIEQRQIQKARGGDRDAFGAIYDRHGPKVFHLLRRLTGGDSASAEDLTQETFLAAWESLPTWRGRGALSTWLCGIAVNRYREFRRRKHNTDLPLDDIGGEGSQLESGAKSDPFSRLSEAETVATLEAAIGQLPESCRDAFVLCRVEGWRYREIADALQIPLGTVQSRIHRATQILRMTLSERFSEERATHVL